MPFCNDVPTVTFHVTLPLLACYAAPNCLHAVPNCLLLPAVRSYLPAMPFQIPAMPFLPSCRTIPICLACHFYQFNVPFCMSCRYLPSLPFLPAYHAVLTTLICRYYLFTLPFLTAGHAVPPCASYHLPCGPNSLPFPSCLLCPPCLLFLPVLLYLPACHCYFSVLAASALPAVHTCLLFCHSHPGVPVCPACHFHSCLPAVPSSLSCLPDCPAVPT